MVQFVHDNIYSNYPFLIDVKSELDVFIISSADILFEDGTCSTHLHPLVKDRVYRFGGSLSKRGISLELSNHFMNAIHQIEGNYLLYDSK